MGVLSLRYSFFPFFANFTQHSGKCNVADSLVSEVWGTSAIIIIPELCLAVIKSLLYSGSCCVEYKQAHIPERTINVKVEICSLCIRKNYKDANQNLECQSSHQFTLPNIRAEHVDFPWILFWKLIRLKQLKVSFETNNSFNSKQFAVTNWKSTLCTVHLSLLSILTIAITMKMKEEIQKALLNNGMWFK